MRVVIVHDYLVADSGAEKVLRALLEIFPQAVLCTLFFDKEKFQDLSGRDIRTSFMDKLPGVKKWHRYFLPLYPLAVRSLSVGGYDLILSSSWAWSKNIKKPKGACHICYCHSPMRFVDGGEDFHLKNKSWPVRAAVKFLVRWIKAWDIRGSGSVDYFIANSKNIAGRIKERYAANAAVIPPPADISFFKPDNRSSRGDYFLIVSRMVPYKNIDVAIQAFNKLGLPLKIVGQGSEYKTLKKIAAPNVEVLGYAGSREKLLELYRGCRAFIMPQEEDWGIAGVEAQACGKPIIAFAKGGALEYVAEGRTGHFFREQTPDALVKAVREFENMKFDAGNIRKNAERYSIETFKEKVSRFAETRYREFLGDASEKDR